MDDDARSQFLLETRREEAMALFDKAKSYAARNDQLIALGAALIAAIAGLGLKEEDAEWVLLGVPAAICLLVIYSAQVDSDVRVMGAARKRIEVVLEAELGAPALIYYSCAAPPGLHGSTRAAVGAGLVLGAGASVAGFVVALGISTVVACLYSVVTLMMAGAAIAVVLGMLKTEADAKARVATWARKKT